MAPLKSNRNTTCEAEREDRSNLEISSKNLPLPEKDENEPTDCYSDHGARKDLAQSQ